MTLKRKERHRQCFSGEMDRKTSFIAWPFFDYAAPIVNQGYSDLSKKCLQLVQNKFLHLITGTHTGTSVDNLNRNRHSSGRQPVSRACTKFLLSDSLIRR